MKIRRRRHHRRRCRFQGEAAALQAAKDLRGACGNLRFRISAGIAIRRRVDEAE